MCYSTNIDVVMMTLLIILLIISSTNSFQPLPNAFKDFSPSISDFFTDSQSKVVINLNVFLSWSHYERPSGTLTSAVCTCEHASIKALRLSAVPSASLCLSKSSDISRKTAMALVRICLKLVISYWVVRLDLLFYDFVKRRTAPSLLTLTTEADLNRRVSTVKRSKAYKII